MFGRTDSGIGLLAGETSDGFEAEDEFAFGLTCRLLADGWVDEDQHCLPDLNRIPPGPFLAVVLEGVDRSRLNGFDLVCLLQARERLVSHCQAGSMADMVEISYAAPGGRDVEPGRLLEAFEYASDEIRAALSLTRRGGEYRLGFAVDVVERLPRVFELLDRGLIDVARARVLVDGPDLDEAPLGLGVDQGQVGISLGKVAQKAFCFKVYIFAEETEMVAVLQ